MLFRWLNFLLNYSNYPRAYMIMRWLIPAIIRLSGPRVGYLPLKCLVLQYWIYGRFRPFNVWKLSCKIWSDNLCNKWVELPKFKQTIVKQILQKIWLNLFIFSVSHSLSLAGKNLKPINGALQCEINIYDDLP